VPDNWAELSDDEKREVAGQMADVLISKLRRNDDKP